MRLWCWHGACGFLLFAACGALPGGSPDALNSGPPSPSEGTTKHAVVMPASDATPFDPGHPVVESDRDGRSSTLVVIQRPGVTTVPQRAAAEFRSTKPSADTVRSGPSSERIEYHATPRPEREKSALHSDTIILPMRRIRRGGTTRTGDASAEAPTARAKDAAKDVNDVQSRKSAPVEWLKPLKRPASSPDSSPEPGQPTVPIENAEEASSLPTDLPIVVEGHDQPQRETVEQSQETEVPSDKIDLAGAAKTVAEIEQRPDPRPGVPDRATQDEAADGQAVPSEPLQEDVDSTVQEAETRREPSGEGVEDDKQAATTHQSDDGYATNPRLDTGKNLVAMPHDTGNDGIATPQEADKQPATWPPTLEVPSTSSSSDPLVLQGEPTGPTDAPDDAEQGQAREGTQDRTGSLDAVLLVGSVLTGTIVIWLGVGWWKRRTRRSLEAVSHREPAAPTHDGWPIVNNGRSQADERLRDPMQLWENACARADLVSCRQMLSTLASGTDPMVVARLNRQLRQVTAAAQRTLRTRFAKCVREQRFADALAIGERICEQMPDSLMATDFERLRQHLLSRLGATRTGNTAATQHRTTRSATTGHG